MIPKVETHAEGSRFGLRVSPGSAREAVRGVLGDLLKISVREPPERGKANRGVVRLLARALDVPKRSVVILGGETSSTKTILVRGVSPDTLRGIFRKLLDQEDR